MTTIEISGTSGISRIHIGESIANLQKYLPQKKIVVITDTNVNEHYIHYFCQYETIVIGTGEQVKTIDTVQEIFEKLIAMEADRSTFIVGIGGGIVCDITGFVASTYMRGVEFGFVSSTLLSQVDASVGGKNGVNFKGFKNFMGVFNQPEFVICDTQMLHSLPKADLLCGFAEIVKHTLIADAEMFKFLENNYHKALSLDNETIEKLVVNSVKIKSDIVNKDEKESGERRKLNFGHTMGHAVESTQKIPHGEAVSIGINTAANLSVNKGLLNVNDAKRIVQLLKNFGLPTELIGDKEVLIEAMKKDKKRSGESINFVLLTDIGSAIVEKLSIEELKNI